MDSTVQITAGDFKATSRWSLFCRQWTTPNSTMPLVLVHGGGEHSNRHAELAERLAQRGYAVEAFDLPGHGRSPGTRGHIPHFSEYLVVLDAFVQLVRKRYAGKKPILFGHSLGGLITAVYAADHGAYLRAVALSSPLWGLNVPVPAWKHLIAYTLVRVWPSLTLRRPALGPNTLSHDPAVEVDYLRDPLVHFQASLRLYVDSRRQLDLLPETVRRLKIPILVQQAGEDRIASAPATEALFPLIGSEQKRLIIYPGYSHEIFHEIGKEAVFLDFFEWLAACP